MKLKQSEFEQLLALRTGLRQFLNWSEEQARAAGLTPTQHQLLLAVRGHDNPTGPTIGEIASYLVLRHHSASELVNRAAAAGLVERTRDQGSASVVRVTLTPAGSEKLNQLAAAHLEELAHLAPAMRPLWRALDKAARDGSEPIVALSVKSRVAKRRP